MAACCGPIKFGVTTIVPGRKLASMMCVVVRALLLAGLEPRNSQELLTNLLVLCIFPDLSYCLGIFDRQADRGTMVLLVLALLYGVGNILSKKGGLRINREIFILRKPLIESRVPYTFPKVLIVE